MNVVDSSGWIEYFQNGPNAALSAPALNDPAQLVVPTIVLFETYRHALREKGAIVADEQYTLMTASQVVPLTADLSTIAATIAHDMKLAMADAIILATAREHGAVLWTQDLDLGRIQGVQYRAKVKP